MASLSYKTIMWVLPDALFLIFVLVSIMGVVMAFIVTSLDVREGESNIAVHRLYLSPNGFSSEDVEIGRLYPGIIKTEKVEDSKIQNALAYGDERVVIAGNFKIEPSSDIPGAGTYRKEAYLHREKYQKEWIVFAQLAEDGVQGKTIDSYREFRYVVVQGRSMPLGSIVLRPK